jgi:integrase/rubredoxin
VAEGEAGFHNHQDSSILDKASLKNGKLDKHSPLAQPPKQPNTTTNLDPKHGRSRSQILKCPECGSTRLYKDGLRYLSDGTTVQRWLCRNCGYRFSEKKPLQKNQNWQINTPSTFLSKRQVCELLTRASKNLTTVETRQETAQREGAQQSRVDVEGEILRYLVWLKNQAYSHHTIRSRASLLGSLTKKKADLNDPESVKEAIANANNWSETTKLLATTAYDSFLKWQGKTWIPPRYKQTQKLPFIPIEEELNALIAVCGKKVATMLQILKETGARLGEAFQLEWTDIDFGRHTIRINHPEKGSNPRILPITEKLAGMINTLPKKNPKIFGDGSLKTFETSFWNQRKKAAFKLQNPRLKAITYHTFRHWKATMEYHKTHDIFHVQRLLGHKNIQNTAIYITLENSVFQAKDDEFHAAVAKNLEEACKLVEIGFEYVCDVDNAKVFRKRK